MAIVMYNFKALLRLVQLIGKKSDDKFGLIIKEN